MNKNKKIMIINKKVKIRWINKLKWERITLKMMQNNQKRKE